MGADEVVGESFSDDPECGSPVIGAFLRMYNDALDDYDALDDSRRQDLYPYAASAVGTRASAAVESFREERCRTWACARALDPARGRWTRRRLAAMRFAADATPEDRGSMAAHIAIECVRRGGATAHTDALAFVDELIAGPRASSAPESRPELEPVSSRTR